MEEITTTGSPAATLNKTAKQPRPFFLALLLTSALYFGVRQPVSHTAVAVSESSQTNTSLSVSVKDAVIQDLSHREALPKSALRIVEAKQLTWFDRCLNIADSDVWCSQALVPGWQVTVASTQKRWIYLTNTSGSVVKLDNTIPSSSTKIQEVAIAMNFRIKI